MNFERYIPRDMTDILPRTRVIFDLNTEAELRTQVRRASLTRGNDVAPMDKDAQRLDGTPESLILRGQVDLCTVEKMLDVQSRTRIFDWRGLETILSPYL